MRHRLPILVRGTDAPEIRLMPDTMAKTEPTTDIGTFARNLRWELERSKKTATKIAKLCQTTNAHFSRWLNGHSRNPHPRTLELLAEAFGYDDPESILSDEHIARRTKSPRQKADSHAPLEPTETFGHTMSFSMTEVMAAIDKSRLGPQAAITAMNELLASDAAPFASLVVHLLRQKMQ